MLLYTVICTCCNLLLAVALSELLGFQLFWESRNAKSSRWRLETSDGSVLPTSRPMSHVRFYRLPRFQVRCCGSSVRQWAKPLAVKLCSTLRASLSGTFIQTLPDLVTPLKGTLYLREAVHRRGQRPPKGLGTNHTPSIAFRHPPPNYARFIVTPLKGHSISAQLSSDAVSALRKVLVLIWL